MRRRLLSAKFWVAVSVLTLACGASWTLSAWALFGAPSPPRVEIDRREAFVGRIAIGREIAVEFPVRNSGGTRLILRSAATCDCEDESPAEILLLPGTSGTIRIAFTAPPIPGPMRREFSFLTNDEHLPQLVLVVHADVCVNP